MARTQPRTSPRNSKGTIPSPAALGSTTLSIFGERMLPERFFSPDYMPIDNRGPGRMYDPEYGPMDRLDFWSPREMQQPPPLGIYQSFPAEAGIKGKQGMVIANRMVVDRYGQQIDQGNHPTTGTPPKDMNKPWYDEVQSPDQVVQGGQGTDTLAGGGKQDILTPSGVTLRVSARTGLSGLDQRALAAIQGMVNAAPAAGIAVIDITAGREGGHLSHLKGGTEVDLKGYNADGTLWTPEQRVAIAAGAQVAGADRFGLYSFGKRYTGNGSLHVGFSGRAGPPAVWGYNGRVRGDSSRRFTNPAEKAFLAAHQQGRQFDIASLGLDASPAASSKGDPAVTQLQTYLAQNGFDPGPVNGVMSEKTMAALNSYNAAADPESDMLARVMLAEAMGEGPEGMAAVAWVARNRTMDQSGLWPKDIAGVVTQKGQFAAPLANADPAAYAEAFKIATQVRRAPPEQDPTGGATYFKTGAVNPQWAKVEPFKARIGNHEFYGQVRTEAPTTQMAYADAIDRFDQEAPAQQAIAEMADGAAVESMAGGTVPPSPPSRPENFQWTGGGAPSPDMLGAGPRISPRHFPASAPVGPTTPEGVLDMGPEARPDTFQWMGGGAPDNPPDPNLSPRALAMADALDGLSPPMRPDNFVWTGGGAPDAGIVPNPPPRGIGSGAPPAPQRLATEGLASEPGRLTETERASILADLEDFRRDSEPPAITSVAGRPEVPGSLPAAPFVSPVASRQEVIGGLPSAVGFDDLAAEMQRRFGDISVSPPSESQPPPAPEPPRQTTTDRVLSILNIPDTAGIDQYRPMNRQALTAALLEQEPYAEQRTGGSQALVDLHRAIAESNDLIPEPPQPNTASLVGGPRETSPLWSQPGSGQWMTDSTTDIISRGEGWPEAEPEVANWGGDIDWSPTMDNAATMEGNAGVISPAAEITASALEAADDGMSGVPLIGSYGVMGTTPPRIDIGTYHPGAMVLNAPGAAIAGRPVGSGGGNVQITQPSSPLVQAPPLANGRMSGRQGGMFGIGANWAGPQWTGQITSGSGPYMTDGGMVDNTWYRGQTDAMGGTNALSWQDSNGRTITAYENTFGQPGYTMGYG